MSPPTIVSIEDRDRLGTHEQRNRQCENSRRKCSERRGRQRSAVRRADGFATPNDLLEEPLGFEGEPKGAYFLGEAGPLPTV